MKPYGLPSGTCRVCGCTDAQACPDGCSWVDAQRTLCSACAGTIPDVLYELKRIVRLLDNSHRAARVAYRARRRLEVRCGIVTGRGRDKTGRVTL